MLKQREFNSSIWRQNKQGFTFPVARWLKNALRQTMDKLLSKENWKGGLINVSYLNRLKDEHIKGKRNNYRILFNLMVFRKWLENYPQVSLKL